MEDRHHVEGKLRRTLGWLTSARGWIARAGERKAVPLNLNDLLLPASHPPTPVGEGIDGESVTRLPDHIAKKTLWCRLGVHQGSTEHIANMGWDFGRCRSCSTELIRIFGGRWRTVPKGYRIVQMSRAERNEASRTES